MQRKVDVLGGLTAVSAVQGYIGLILRYLARQIVEMATRIDRQFLATSDALTKTHITDKRHDLQGQRSWSKGHVMRLKGS